MNGRSRVKNWLTDMDGVLWHEGMPIPGATELIKKWQDEGTEFLVLTNNSAFTPRDLAARLQSGGLDVPEERIYTSALATADFVKSQKPHGTAFVIGEVGLTTAMHEIVYVMTEVDPD
jgi:NagD protein